MHIIIFKIFFLHFLYRDLKPENVLIDKEGHVRLCDFGFATPIAPGQLDGAAPLQDGCGTVMYMAPELVGKSLKTTHGYPVDWWALGCVLVEMITGKPLFVCMIFFSFLLLLLSFCLLVCLFFSSSSYVCIHLVILES